VGKILRLSASEDLLRRALSAQSAGFKLHFHAGRHSVQAGSISAQLFELAQQPRHVLLEGGAGDD
jgi:hypothetical protein